MFSSPLDYDRPITPKLDVTLGYLYFLDHDHPLASPPTGKVYHHRHVMSVKLGRWVQSDEVVHHKDEVKTNNRPDNLEIKTNSDHSREHKPIQYPPRPCALCGNEFKPHNKDHRCCSRDCTDRNRRKFDLPRDQLEALVWTLPTSQLAKKLGVSDVAISKRCRKLGISKPPRGYWTKKRAHKL